jgi:hypothetical protein
MESYNAILESRIPKLSRFVAEKWRTITQKELFSILMHESLEA